MKAKQWKNKLCEYTELLGLMSILAVLFSILILGTGLIAADPVHQPEPEVDGVVEEEKYTVELIDGTEATEEPVSIEEFEQEEQDLLLSAVKEDGETSEKFDGENVLSFEHNDNYLIEVQGLQYLAIIEVEQKEERDSSDEERVYTLALIPLGIPVSVFFIFLFVHSAIILKPKINSLLK